MITITAVIDPKHPQALAAQMAITEACRGYSHALTMMEVVEDEPKPIEAPGSRVVQFEDYRKVRVIPNPHAPFPGMAS